MQYQETAHQKNTGRALKTLCMILLAVMIVASGVILPGGLTAKAKDGKADGNLRVIPEKVNITFKWSSMDGQKKAEDYVITCEKGSNLADVLRSEIEKIDRHFAVKGYNLVGYTNNPITNYSSEKEMSADRFNPDEKETIESDITVYFSVEKHIKTVRIKANAPLCGEKTETEYDGTLPVWTSQTNRPKVTVSGEGVELAEDIDDQHPTYWVKDEPAGVVPYIGDFEYGKKYNATVEVKAKFGYIFQDDDQSGQDDDQDGQENEELPEFNGDPIVLDGCYGNTEQIEGLVEITEHDWGYTGEFIWEGSEEKGYTGAKNEYECLGCEKVEYVDAIFEKNHKDPTCTMPGSDSYTAILDRSKALQPDAAGLEYKSIFINPTGHKWGEWEVEKPATETEEGIEIRVCQNDDSHFQVRSIPKLKPNSDDPKKKPEPKPQPTPKPQPKPDKKAKRTFAPLKAKAAKAGKKSVTVSWKNIKKAKKFVIYGNKCSNADKKRVMKKTKVVKAPAKGKKQVSLKLKKMLGKKIKKGTYYKMYIAALDADGKVIAKSATMHVSTKGGKTGNYTKVKVNAKGLKKGKLKIAKGNTVKLNAKAIGEKGKKIHSHRVVRYESTNTKIATVTKSGKVKAKAKGKAKIFAYAQNGVAKGVVIIIK